MDLAPSPPCHTLLPSPTSSSPAGLVTGADKGRAQPREWEGSLMSQVWGLVGGLALGSCSQAYQALRPIPPEPMLLLPLSETETLPISQSPVEAPPSPLPQPSLGTGHEAGSPPTASSCQGLSPNCCHPVCLNYRFLHQLPPLSDSHAFKLPGAPQLQSHGGLPFQQWDPGLRGAPRLLGHDPPLRA